MKTIYEKLDAYIENCTNLMMQYANEAETELLPNHTYFKKVESALDSFKSNGMGALMFVWCDLDQHLTRTQQNDLYNKLERGFNNAYARLLERIPE